MSRKPSVGISAICLLVAGLCACPPPDPVLGIKGASLSVLGDGRSRISVLVTNYGYDDFNGEVCLRTTWVAEPVFEVDKDFGTVMTAGTVLQEGSTCVPHTIVHDGDVGLGVESTAVLPKGAFAVVVLEQGELVDSKATIVSASE